MGQIAFTDLLAQEGKRDPVAFFARLREQEPLSVSPPSHVIALLWFSFLAWRISRAPWAHTATSFVMRQELACSE